MPHLDLSPSELDRLYPPIAAPVDERLDDMADDTKDATLQNGMRIADEIRTAMMVQGRTRQRDSAADTETARPASLDFMTGAGVRQSPELSICGIAPTHQVSSTPIMQGRARHTLPPSDGGLPTCTEKGLLLGPREQVEGLLLGPREQVDGLPLGPREQADGDEHVPWRHVGVAILEMPRGTFCSKERRSAAASATYGGDGGAGREGRQGAFVPLSSLRCASSSLDTLDITTPGMSIDAFI